MVLRLWAYCQIRQRWKLDISTEALRIICQSKLDAETVKTSLMSAKFLDEKNGLLIVHDWEVFNRYLVSAWKNGSKGGRPRQTDRKPTGSRSGTDRKPVTSNHIISNSTLSTEGESEGKNGSDITWLGELQNDPAYKGIDVAREHAKMARWCKENKQIPTRRRFVNWLNRADKPLSLIPFNKPAATEFYEAPPEPTEPEKEKAKTAALKMAKELKEKWNRQQS